MNSDEIQMVLAARGLALAAHRNVWNDHAEEPYIAHPQRVSGYVPWAAQRLGINLTDRQRSVAGAAAWLHDTIEDVAWVTPAWLAEVFPDYPDLVDCVVDLTFDQIIQGTRAAYYAEIDKSDLARVVKLADLMDNADPVRLSKVRDPDKRSYFIDKYVKASKAIGVEEALKAWQRIRIGMVEDPASAKSMRSSMGLAS